MKEDFSKQVTLSCRDGKMSVDGVPVSGLSWRYIAPDRCVVRMEVGSKRFAVDLDSIDEGDDWEKVVRMVEW